MPYPTKDELLEMLRARQHRQVIEEHLVTGIPYVFAGNEPAYQDFRGTLAAQFNTPIEDVSMIGSGRIGFSLDPDKFGAAFHASSDIDAVVVNAEMFDRAWFELYGLGLRVYALPQRVQTAVREHRTNNVFYGYIEPELLPGAVGINRLWFSTLQSVGGRIRLLAGHGINGRLYRTWDHVRAHQQYSLDCIKTKYIR